MLNLLGSILWSIELLLLAQLGHNFVLPFRGLIWSAVLLVTHALQWLHLDDFWLHRLLQTMFEKHARE